MAHLVSLLLLCLMFVPNALLRRQHAASTSLEVAGHWELNEELSDEVPLLPGEAVAVARASGALGAGAAAARSRVDRHRAVIVRNALRDAFRASTQLKIVRDGRQLRLTDARGHTLSVVLDGRQQRLERERLRFTVAATWEAPRLTIERQYEDGTIVSDTFLTFRDPRQLVATTTVSHPRRPDQPVVMRRVYDEK